MSALRFLTIVFTLFCFVPISAQEIEYERGCAASPVDGVDICASELIEVPTTIGVSLTADDFASETAFGVFSTDAGAFILGPFFGGTDFGNNETFEASVDVPCCTDGYTFEIADSFGDGICCGFGMGSFTVTTSDPGVNAATALNNTPYDAIPWENPTGAQEAFPFAAHDCIIENTTCPTLVPTMGQWGLLALGLLLLIVSVISIRSYNVRIKRA